MNEPVGSRGSRPPARAVARTFVFLVATLPAANGADGSTAGSRLLPANELVGYIEYEGLAAHSAAWKATAAYDILGRTPSGAMLSDVMRQVLETLFTRVPDRKFNASEILAIEQHLVDHGFARAIYGGEGPQSTVYVLRDVGKPDEQKIKLVSRYVLMPNAPVPLPTASVVRGRRLFRFGDHRESDRQEARVAEARAVAAAELGVATPSAEKRLTTWFEKEDLIIVAGPNADLLSRLQGDGGQKIDLAARHDAQVAAVLDSIEGKQASVATHPAFVAAGAQGRDLAGFEANGLFLDEMSTAGSTLRSFLSTAEVADGGSLEVILFQMLGLHRAQRVVGRWGFRGKSLLTDIRFEASEPWKGMGAMLSPSSVDRKGLPPISEGAGAFAIGTFRQGYIRESLAPLWEAIKPELRPMLDAAERAYVDVATKELREEMSRHLGPTWCVYASPSARMDASGWADPAFLVEVGDAEAAAKVLDKLATRANVYFREQRPGPGKPVMEFERMPLPERGYRLASPAGAVPWLTDQLQPTVLVGKAYIAAASSPGLARAAIAAETQARERYKQHGELISSLGCVPEKLSFLIVGNPRDSFWPEAITSFPSTAEPLIRKFVGLPVDGLSGEAPATDLLGLLGVKRGKSPTAEDIRSCLFPSVIAGIVDDRTFRVIALEAMPFAFLGAEIKHSEPGASKVISIEVKFGPGRAP